MYNFIPFSFLLWSSFFLTPWLVLVLFYLFSLHFTVQFLLNFYAVANVF